MIKFLKKPMDRQVTTGMMAFAGIRHYQEHGPSSLSKSTVSALFEAVSMDIEDLRQFEVILYDYVYC